MIQETEIVAAPSGATATYDTLFALAADVHLDNAKWWTDLVTGASLLESRPRLSLLMLVVTEVGEYIDARASGAMDGQCPGFTHAAIELADVAIRLLDMIGAEDKRLGHPHTSRLAMRDGEPLDVLGLIQALALAAECWRKERVATYRAALNVALWITCEIAAATGIDLPAAVSAKRGFNRIRADHSFEARRAPGGKKE